MKVTRPPSMKISSMNGSVSRLGERPVSGHRLPQPLFHLPRVAQREAAPGVRRPLVGADQVGDHLPDVLGAALGVELELFDPSPR